MQGAIIRRSCQLFSNSLRGGVGRSLLLVFSTFFFSSYLVAAPVSVNVGVFSFDVLIPGTPVSPGLNQFTINNFTGLDNLAPDFPVIDNAVFQNISVNVGSGPISISDVGPGSTLPGSLTFVDTDAFTSASFEATVSSSQLALADGTVLDLASNVVSGTILPSTGPELTAGTDFVLLSVTGTINSVPEPGGRPLVLTILLITLLIHVPLMSARFRGSAPSMRAKLCLAKWLHEPQNILER